MYKEIDIFFSPQWCYVIIYLAQATKYAFLFYLTLNLCYITHIGWTAKPTLLTLARTARSLFSRGLTAEPGRKASPPSRKSPYLAAKPEDIYSPAQQDLPAPWSGYFFSLISGLILLLQFRRHIFRNQHQSPENHLRSAPSPSHYKHSASRWHIHYFSRGYSPGYTRAENPTSWKLGHIDVYCQIIQKASCPSPSPWCEHRCVLSWPSSRPYELHSGADALLKQHGSRNRFMLYILDLSHLQWMPPGVIQNHPSHQSSGHPRCVRYRQTVFRISDCEFTLSFATQINFCSLSISTPVNSNSPRLVCKDPEPSQVMIHSPMGQWSLLGYVIICASSLNARWIH